MLNGEKIFILKNTQAKACGYENDYRAKSTQAKACGYKSL
jgi:hypothetical protein